MRFGFRYKPKDRLANAIAACNCHVKASAACIGGDRVHVHRHNMGCRGWYCSGHRREDSQCNTNGPIRAIWRAFSIALAGAAWTGRSGYNVSGGDRDGNRSLERGSCCDASYARAAMFGVASSESVLARLDHDLPTAASDATLIIAGDPGHWADVHGRLDAPTSSPALFSDGLAKGGRPDGLAER